MNVPLHIIKQQRMELTVPSEAQVSHVEARLKELYHHEVLPELDKVFSRLAPSGTTIEVPHLEVDIGSIPPEELEVRFSELVVAHISKQLEQMIAKLFAGEGNDISVRSTADSEWDTWLHFLESGNMPWWSGIAHGEWPPVDVLDHLTLSPPSVKDQLLEVLKSAHARQRLIWQFDTDFTRELLHHLLTDYKSAGAYLNALNSLLLDLSVILSQHDQNMAILAALVSTSPHGNDDAFVAQLARHLVRLPDMKSQVFLTGHLAPGNLPASSLTNKHGLRLLNNLREEARIAAASEAEKETGGETETLPSAGSGTEIYISNAGLVLLWPYLVKLFENLGLVADNAFKSPEASHKAIHMLQYAATRETSSPEHLLPLNKILCGIPWNMPVELDGNLTEDDKAEIESLLESVIRNWEALKNTSNDGLRNTFLNRNGKLLHDEGSWHLLVKRNSFDVLLDKLPWNIGLVKLPWMPGPIHVQW